MDDRARTRAQLLCSRRRGGLGGSGAALSVRWPSATTAGSAPVLPTLFLLTAFFFVVAAVGFLVLHVSVRNLGRRRLRRRRAVGGSCIHRLLLEMRSGEGACCIEALWEPKSGAPVSQPEGRLCDRAYPQSPFRSGCGLH